ncbi:DUF6643 family protein [Streptomyces sp. NPDC060011]|uniref:DUF6643 family protein n=1 Tax=unclassified Streptomyces TaxID=2593676 RepID=UPI00224DBBEA|nr:MULTISPECIES: DUF6643 family protein [unclassified Streptomyces]MCX5137247.1 hypothetical protein [Streptomyces sp. NBC_00340]WSK64974.1 hypothetical protein OG458_36570 [Streptomyces sp. NBC_01281]
MTSPRSTYGGGYYSAFQDTPIYDSLVAERGTPQIAPIRVPSAYDSGSHLPALPSALPALPAGPSHQASSYGYQQTQQPAPLHQAPAPYIPQQAGAPRGYPGQQPQQPRPMSGNTGYEAMRPAAPRPAPTPYQDPYNNGQQYRGY